MKISDRPGGFAHDWFEKTGGAEKVALEILKEFPNLQTWCLWNDDPKRTSGFIVNESRLAGSGFRNNKKLAIPVMLRWWPRLSHGSSWQPEWILTSSHLFAHHARFKKLKNLPKLSYVYSPARYVWVPEIDQRGQKPIYKLISRVIRPLDRYRARQSLAICTISRYVADRIQNTWGVTASVIYPPVDISFFGATSEAVLNDHELSILQALPTEFALGVSRMVPYKRLEKVIRFGQVNELSVVIVGNGPEMGRLQKTAESNLGTQVIFVTEASDQLLREIYRKAQVFVFPPIEDFGIVPVEAMATGTPVVACSIGGTAETILNGKTGFLLDNFDDDEMRTAYSAIKSISSQDCVARAREFAGDRFRIEFRDWVNKSLSGVSDASL